MNESIKKTDRRGRMRYAPEQKKTMVDAYLASGLSAPRFASLHGVPYQALVSWIRKDRTAGSADTLLMAELSSGRFTKFTSKVLGSR